MKDRGRVERYALVLATIAFVEFGYAALVAPHLDPDRRLVVFLLIVGAMLLGARRITAWADGVEWEGDDWW